jgi:hypothetical protein
MKTHFNRPEFEKLGELSTACGEPSGLTKGFTKTSTHTFAVTCKRCKASKIFRAYDNGTPLPSVLDSEKFWAKLSAAFTKHMEKLA